MQLREMELSKSKMSAPSCLIFILFTFYWTWNSLWYDLTFIDLELPKEKNLKEKTVHWVLSQLQSLVKINTRPTAETHNFIVIYFVLKA